MIYEYPLGYLLGLEGIALMRAFTGDFDRAFIERRIAEVRALLADELLAAEGVTVSRVDTVNGYRDWAPTYDDPGNPLFAFDEPLVREILDPQPTSIVLDAACGTGRMTEYLAAQGHKVVGVDSSPDMLARAQARVPGAEFRLGDLHQLPLSDDAVDVVVCALALSHISDIGPVIAEFARVLRPGGQLVITDLHDEQVFGGGTRPFLGPDGNPGRMPSYRHRAGDFLGAALPRGFQVRRYEEPAFPPGVVPEENAPLPAAATTVGPWDDWPWSISAMVPEAARAANFGAPVMIIWHFKLAES